jgi:hypothetical protein
LAPRPFSTLGSLLAVAALVVAGCSGSKPQATTTTVETTTSTTVATTTTAAPTTTAVPAPVAPLTGLPPAAGVDLSRPALVVKIDNHPDARPQAGLDVADIVFDIRAEGVTRFFTVFHSQTPDPVGPVRSSRTSDFDLLKGFDHPLYASSGGNDYVMRNVPDLPVQAVTNYTRNEYYRDKSRSAPHNLFVKASDLWALSGGPSPPKPWFAYRAANEAVPASAVDATGTITINFTGGPVTAFTWDPNPNVKGWARTMDGKLHKVADGTQIAPENVVVLETTYRTSPADAKSPEVVSVGSGKAVVLTAGKIIVGTWSRPSATSKPVLTDTSGAPIALTPGRTWVEMPEAGQTHY